MSERGDSPPNGRETRLSPPCWPDGTERPLHRPVEPEEQQEFYRGKKKGHTIKNLFIIDETCQMCFLSTTDEGKAHEKSLADVAGDALPRGSCL